MLLARWWCRRNHQGHIVPTIVGYYLCTRCGIGYADLADAGRLCLDEYEREMPVAWSARVLRVAETETERHERAWRDARSALPLRRIV
jgi:hypothetical protein